MKAEEVLKVTNGELRKLKVIEQVIEKKIKQKKAAKLLGLSVRQIIRLAKKIRREGAKGIIHRLRGKASNRKHEEKFKKRVLELCRKKYEDFGPTLAQEKLEEINKVVVNRETLRQWMLKEGLWETSKKGHKHRQWRQRRGCFGELVQADGSHHDWLEGRGPWLVLMGYIDDATGKVFAWFYDYEGTIPVMESFYRYVKRYGLPLGLYMDKHGAYQSSKGPSLEEQLKGKEKALTQFGRALEELGVELIPAHSPQAKGRIERLFKTFQDRLVKEMRLADIKTKEEANQFLQTYLPKYNQRFAVKAREEANLHRSALRDQELRRILSIQEKRVVRNDGTIRYGTKLYQILDAAKSLREVVVQERIDGKIYIVDKSKDLAYRELKEPPKQMKPKKKARKSSKLSRPPMNHPFKQKSFENYLWKEKMKTLKIESQNQKTPHLNAFEQVISNKDGIYHHPNSTDQQLKQLQQKEERSKEEKELLLIHS